MLWSLAIACKGEQQHDALFYLIFIRAECLKICVFTRKLLISRISGNLWFKTSISIQEKKLNGMR